MPARQGLASTWWEERGRASREDSASVGFPQIRRQQRLRGINNIPQNGQNINNDERNATSSTAKHQPHAIITTAAVAAATPPTLTCAHGYPTALPPTSRNQ